jgi:hypothetical protein
MGAEQIQSKADVLRVSDVKATCRAAPIAEECSSITHLGLIWGSGTGREDDAINPGQHMLLELVPAISIREEVKGCD